MLSTYSIKDHALSRVDVRIKLIAGLIILLMILTSRDFIFPLLIFLSCLFLCLLLRIPLKVFLSRFSEPLFIVIVIMLIKLFSSGEEALFSFSLSGTVIRAYREGFIEGLKIALRIMGAVSVVAVIGFSSPFTELIAGLYWWKIPKTFIDILLLTHRYIFVLLDDAEVIYNAQKNRLGYSDIRKGLRSFGILSGSLILRAFEHSQNLTISMVQRGYEGEIPLFRHKSFKRSEVVIFILILLVMAILWWNCNYWRI